MLKRALTESIIARFRQLIDQAVAKRLPGTSKDSAQLGQLSYTYLMGITQTWLFSPRLFSLKQEAPFFQRQFWSLLDRAMDTESFG